MSENLNVEHGDAGDESRAKKRVYDSSTPLEALLRAQDLRPSEHKEETEVECVRP